MGKYVERKIFEKCRPNAKQLYKGKSTLRFLWRKVSLIFWALIQNFRDHNRLADSTIRISWNFCPVSRFCQDIEFLKYHFSVLPHGGPESDRERRDLNFDRYNREDPCIGMKQILTGFSKWSDRYISSCNGQKKHSHQKKRMLKWKYKLSKGKSWKNLRVGYTVYTTIVCTRHFCLYLRG